MCIVSIITVIYWFWYTQSPDFFVTEYPVTRTPWHFCHALTRHEDLLQHSPSLGKNKRKSISFFLFLSSCCKLMHLSIARILIDMIEFKFSLGVCIYPLHTEARQSWTPERTKTKLISRKSSLLVRNVDNYCPIGQLIHSQSRFQSSERLDACNKCNMYLNILLL